MASIVLQNRTVRRVCRTHVRSKKEKVQRKLFFALSQYYLVSIQVFILETKEKNSTKNGKQREKKNQRAQKTPKKPNKKTQTSNENG